MSRLEERLLVIEGLDGSCKGTVCKEIQKRFSSRKIFLHKFPTNQKINETIIDLKKEIKRYPDTYDIEKISYHEEIFVGTLKVSVANLFFIDQVLGEDKLAMEHECDEEDLILCDRFWHSNICYQEPLLSEVEHTHLVDHIHDSCITPANMIFLDVDPRTGIQRVIDRLAKEDPEFVGKVDENAVEYLTRVRDNYFDLFGKMNTNVYILNADEPINIVLDRATNIVEDILELEDYKFKY